MRQKLICSVAQPSQLSKKPNFLKCALCAFSGQSRTDVQKYRLLQKNIIQRELYTILTVFTVYTVYIVYKEYKEKHSIPDLPAVLQTNPVKINQADFQIRPQAVVNPQ